MKKEYIFKTTLKEKDCGKEGIAYWATDGTTVITWTARIRIHPFSSATFKLVRVKNAVYRFMYKNNERRRFKQLGGMFVVHELSSAQLLAEFL